MSSIILELIKITQDWIDYDLMNYMLVNHILK